MALVIPLCSPAGNVGIEIAEACKRICFHRFPVHAQIVSDLLRRF